MLDLPALYLDYNKGPLWLRVGNQQIAWGEALFFRVFDVVQGLDLRRHSVLGVAAEEYSTAAFLLQPFEAATALQMDGNLEGYALPAIPSVNTSTPWHTLQLSG